MRKGSAVFLLLCCFCLWTGSLAKAGVPASVPRSAEAADVAVSIASVADSVSGYVPLKWWQVPKVVRRNVRLAYPYRLYRDWAKEDGLYKVRVISTDYEAAYFDSTGEWVRARHPMRMSELPYRTYLFIKEEFKLFRFIVGYRLQERDDLAHYYVELEHKRIHSLKTYLEFDFFGTLTKLDGHPVGEVQDEASTDQEEWARLYAEVYDAEAEEAAYAADASEAAADRVADTVSVQPLDTVSVALVDTLVAVVYTLVAVVDTLVAVGDTVVVTDTVAPEPMADAASVYAMDTLSVQPFDTASVALADTLSVQPFDTLSVALADTLSVQPLDTVSVALADTLVALADTSVQPIDTLVGEDVLLCPAIVENNFVKRFPGGQDAVWRHRDTLYIASFTQYGKPVMAAFREDGFQIYTAYGMDRKELPLPIGNYIKTSGKGMKMEEGWRVAYEAKYRRQFIAAERPQDYYYVVMSKKQPKGKQRQYLRFVFNQKAQFESQSSYDAYLSEK